MKTNQEDVKKQFEDIVEHLEKLRNQYDTCQMDHKGTSPRFLPCKDIHFSIYEFEYANKKHKVPEGINIMRKLGDHDFSIITLAECFPEVTEDGVLIHRLEEKDNVKISFYNLNIDEEPLDMAAFKNHPCSEVAIDIAIHAGILLKEKISAEDSRKFAQDIKEAAISFEQWWRSNNPDARDYIETVDAFSDLLLMYRYNEDGRKLAAGSDLSTFSFALKMLHAAGGVAIANTNTRLLNNLRSALDSVEATYEIWRIVEDLVFFITKPEWLAKEKTK